ncbi:MAG TPA: DUF4270 family protein, partial [Bacteroidia bacterium]|nr:DUF4270 family protein [Bacteroidia bacterium]
DLLNVGWEDSTTIFTRTVDGDSLITDESLISSGVALIGKYIDPIFGPATASMYTQVRLPTGISSTTFGTSPTCDSIILSLVYEGTVYGKKERKDLKLSVHQVTDVMSTATTYYSNSTLTYNSVDLTETDGHLFKANTFDSVATVGGLLLKPQVRARLDNSFGQLLLNNATMGNLIDNASFQSLLNGIYITTENTTGLLSEDGNIVHFKMGESKITLYYQNSTTDSLSYDFSLGSVARFNHFEHDYSTGGIDSQLDMQINNPTPPNQNATVFVQGIAGVKTKIEFPYLMHWVDNGLIGVNKAELVISVDTNLLDLYRLDTFAAPSALILFGINDDGTVYAIPDAFEGATYFGGTYNSGTLQYKFNIARYIQQILDGDRNNNGLYILASNGAVFANRVVIGGASSSTRPMKLNLTYTKIH